MTRKSFSESLYIFGLCLLAASLPLSVFMMSISQFALLASWLISGNIFNKIKIAFSNSVVAILATVYFIHLVGGFYSTDYNYFFNDVRIKIPLLILPVLIYTSPKISEKWFQIILIVFVAAVLISTVCSMGVLYSWLPLRKNITDIRDISVFVSHIRLSLFICFAIFIAAYFLWKNKNQMATIKKTGIILLVLWFIIFLFIMEAMTGASVLLIISSGMFFYFIWKNGTVWRKVFAIALLICIPVLSVLVLKNEAHKIYCPQKVIYNQLEQKTTNGNSYEHYPQRPEQENGNLIWIYLCPQELSSAWNQRSGLKYDGKDFNGNEIKYTLIRFLTSKGLRKDSAGVYALNENEVHAIENGIANVEYQNIGNLRIRLHKTIMEYYAFKNNSDPSGNSVLQRIEYWKTGWNIFKKNFWIGVVTGDVQKAFDYEYEIEHSRLSPEVRHRAHNQYLTFAVSFGIFGFLFFVFSLIHPIFKNKKQADFLYISFLLIVIISMFTEDTLETQAGVSFFAFFNSFLLFAKAEKLNS